MSFILIIIGIVLVVLEALTASTFIIWIAFGFLCAALTSFATSNIIIIATVGIVTTLLSVALLRTKYVRWILPKNRTETSYNEIIGKKAVMKEDYTADGVSVGVATINGVDWSVQCETDNLTFIKGERVMILKIEGVRLFIEKEV
ncbi:NfeD family protein [Mollicutes bacterium LVI A0039]|nr:NfeD family protein [Mollicutes bacterium LVI A0039]